MPTADAGLRNFVIPIGGSALFGAAVVTWLGWWPEIVRDRRPVQRWVRIVPLIMLAAAVCGDRGGRLDPPAAAHEEHDQHDLREHRYGGADPGLRVLPEPLTTAPPRSRPAAR